MNKYEIDNIDIIRKISPECMVLLKSNGDFPLRTPSQIALYGNAARKSIKGGTGSGNVNVRHYVCVEEGLEKVGFEITTKSWLDEYDSIWEGCYKEFKKSIKAKIAEEGISAIMAGIGAIMIEPEYTLPMNGDGDTAIYVLGRISGEGADRTNTKGDFQLTDTEIRDILRLNNQYRKFMLVLNVGGVIDISPIKDHVDNILLLSQLGIAMGDAFADVILGKTYPSGKLASTWAKWEDYCHIGDFGELNDTQYKEGVYVGYRYFDTVEKEPMYRFGFGLGYTEFELNTQKIEVLRNNVLVTLQVRNIGNQPGKEVAQLYVSVPVGKIDQPYQTLAAFVKTQELQPNEFQIVDLKFQIEDIASFDQDTYCDILEKGVYILRVGTSSHNTKVCAVVQLEEDSIVQRLSSVGGTPDFEDWKPKNQINEIIPLGTPLFKIKKEAVQEFIPNVPTIDTNAVEKVSSMSESDLALLCLGAFKGGVGSNSVIGNAGVTVSGSAGETIGILEGVPALIMADGPAGLRLNRHYGVDEKGVYNLDYESISEITDFLPEQMRIYLGLEKPKIERIGETFDQYCTAIPIGTALAQSWNEDVCEICGDLVGSEMDRFNIHIWLAPAMNIHRLPLCGRNFEYYSEDPLISGKMAAAITNGTQKHTGRGVSIKHLCCNNQETNRMHNNTIVSQRALRDIYLRGFKIAVRESNPATIMSSYNLLNGEHTSQRYDLMETLLRHEWGYKGIVMSDWVTGSINKEDDKYPGAIASGAIKAGNDIMMPGTQGNFEDLMNSLNNLNARYPISRKDLEKCAARMVSLAWRLSEKY